MSDTQTEERVTMARVIIEKGHPAFSALAWVLKARSTDIIRKDIQGVQIEEYGVCVCTDGRRLHMAENMPCWAPGYYQGSVSAKQIVLLPNDHNSFPGWRNVMPQGEPRETVTVDGRNGCHSGRFSEPKMVLGRLAVQLSAMVNVRTNGAEAHLHYFNVGFLEPLLGEDWLAAAWDNEKPIRLETGKLPDGIKRTALIMPAQQ